MELLFPHRVCQDGRAFVGPRRNPPIVKSIRKKDVGQLVGQ